MVGVLLGGQSAGCSHGRYHPPGYGRTGALGAGRRPVRRNPNSIGYHVALYSALAGRMRLPPRWWRTPAAYTTRIQMCATLVCGGALSGFFSVVWEEWLRLLDCPSRGSIGDVGTETLRFFVLSTRFAAGSFRSTLAHGSQGQPISHANLPVNIIERSLPRPDNHTGICE